MGDTNAEPERGREIVLMAALLTLTLGVAMWKLRDGVEFRTAAVFVLSVFGVAAILYAMPRRTAVHHHVQAIPFLYVAAAFALAGFARLKRLGLAEKAAAGLLASVMVLLLANHALALSKVEADLAAGRASVDWDKALTLLGEFGASKRQEAVFLLTDWGVATPMFCLAQGQPGLTREVFGDYHGPRDLAAAAGAARTIYVVAPARIAIDHEKSARIARDAAAVEGWKEAPAEPEAAALAPSILVRKFEAAPRS